MKFLDKLSKQLNKNQKIIVSSVVSSILLVITMGITGVPVFERKESIWIIFLLITGYFLFKIWGNKDNKES